MRLCARSSKGASRSGAVHQHPPQHGRGVALLLGAQEMAERIARVAHSSRPSCSIDREQFRRTERSSERGIREPVAALPAEESKLSIRVGDELDALLAVGEDLEGRTVAHQRAGRVKPELESTSETSASAGTVVTALTKSPGRAVYRGRPRTSAQWAGGESTFERHTSTICTCRPSWTRLRHKAPRPPRRS